MTEESKIFLHSPVIQNSGIEVGHLIKAEEGKTHCERETCVALHEHFLSVFNHQDTSTVLEIEQAAYGRGSCYIALI